MTDVKSLIQALQLEPLEPEGGYFRQTYKSAETVITPYGTRSLTTQIYYLITATSFSRFHRVKQTEIYHFYSGAPAEMFWLLPQGGLKRILLGGDPTSGQTPQVIIPPGTWQAVRMAQPAPGPFSLMGATVSPGFEYADFELAAAEDLIQQWPQHAAIIQALC